MEKNFQLMLCKIPESFELKKMRVIQLIKANINMYLRLIWGKDLTHHIIETNQFLLEQLGNQPGYQCSSVVLL